MSESNILIIDDNKDLADGLGMILEDEGYQVTLAYNGHDGLRSFNTGHFDMVLVDYKLPDMNGVALLREVHRKSPKVRAIMMTGFHIEQLFEEIIDDGDAEVVRKPFEIEHILEMVSQMQKGNVLLIADDHPGFGNYLSVYLTDHGINNLLARNPQEAADAVSSTSVEALVLDFRIPVINLLEVFVDLAQQGLSVKTICITGCADEDSGSVDILRSSLVTGCLFKPFRPEEMLKAISRVMARQAGPN